MKYKLTNNKKEFAERTLYQIEALKDFGNIKKGDLGGWIEKECNLSQDDNCWVYRDAWVSGNARVSGNAKLSANLHYKKGWFIGGDDTGEITNITDKTGTDYWKAQYVLGDYEIEERKEQEQEQEQEIEIDGKMYSKSTIKNALREYIN